jgi:hypothetical protein
MASGSLQYSEDWKNVVAKLAQACIGHLYITRMPVVRNSLSFTALQRPYCFGYNSEWITWFLQRDELVNCVEARNFQLLREFFIEPGPSVCGAPEQSNFQGFLFGRRADSPDE